MLERLFAGRLIIFSKPLHIQTPFMFKLVPFSFLYVCDETEETEELRLVFVLQVGDAKKDHACWERPEDMDTPRSVFKVDANAPGSEVAAETAAALAAASLVFRRSDPMYSKLLARRAIRVNLFHSRFSSKVAFLLFPFA